jgi:schlafen family protein
MMAGRRCTILDEASFWVRFGRVEHEALEFKASPNNLREVIPAMAMTRGGAIVLGVTDGRALHGCPLDQRTLDQIMRRAQESGVDVELEPLLVGRVALTVVHVPHVKSRIVTTSDGRLLRRVGSDNLPLRGEQLTRFVRSRRGIAARVRRLLRRGAAAGLRVCQPQRSPTSATAHAVASGVHVAGGEVATG